MNTSNDTEIRSLEQLLKEQNAELVRLLEKVNHLEEMVAQGGALCAPQTRPIPAAKPIPRRWYLRTPSN